MPNQINRSEDLGIPPHIQDALDRLAEQAKQNQGKSDEGKNSVALAKKLKAKKTKGRTR